MDASTGFESGSIIVRNVLNSLAPSIYAASSSSSGSSWKKFLMMIMLKGLMAPIRISAQYES